MRQLLNHTSGLPDYTQDPELFAGIVQNHIWQPRELVALAAKYPQLFASGSAFSYSNTNYIENGRCEGGSGSWKAGEGKLAELLEVTVDRRAGQTGTEVAVGPDRTQARRAAGTPRADVDAGPDPDEAIVYEPGRCGGCGADARAGRRTRT